MDPCCPLLAPPRSDYQVLTYILETH
uniref:Uncharacterized protein n=1 Tax=Rhizophora mucronata TaxID=61149 RepID=A0A2P2PRF1_RHIMU